MAAYEIDDMVIELARIARRATERQIEKQKSLQLGEAFVGLSYAELLTAEDEGR